MSCLLLNFFSPLADREKYPEGKLNSVKEFVQAALRSTESNQLKAVVDVWCEAANPFDRPEWNETVQSLTELEGLDYHYVIGECVSRLLNEIESDLLTMLAFSFFISFSFSFSISLESSPFSCPFFIFICNSRLNQAVTLMMPRTTLPRSNKLSLLPSHERSV